MRTLLFALAAVTTVGTATAQTPLANAPVAPEAIYIARTGATPALSVIDLNGFGQGTGDPAFDVVFSPASEGKSMFPFNPNVNFQGTLLTPPLAPGTSTLDGGSAGVFTLTRDTTLSDRLAAAEGFGSVGDMMLGHPLDTVFNNGPAPFGCQVAGGSLCSTTGLKLVGPLALVPSPTAQPEPLQVGGTGGPAGIPGGGNPITWAPHPNPPPLLTIPLCVDPNILGQEPTSIDTMKAGLFNLLGPGDAQGNPALGIPPSGLLSSSPTSYFVGPSSPQVSIPACNTYQLRQQVGHFLYMVDERSNELVVLNSNRMTVLDTIALPDPTELAIDPNLNFLAVTNRNTDAVSIVDINPGSATFHQVVKTVAVGDQPVGIAWQPDGEDLLVCNAGDSSLSIISAFDLNVRKTVQVGTRHGFALAVTPRHTDFGSQSNVYYAWILDAAGQVWLFESGPAGVNGWGYDDVVTRSGFALSRGWTLQLDPLDPASKVWVVHDGQVDAAGAPTGLTGGAATQLELVNPITGMTPLVPGVAANARGKTIAVARSIGSDELTGRPTDLAFDNLANLGVYPSPTTPFSAGFPAQQNGKHPMRGGLFPTPTNRAQFLFLPVTDGASERIDVIDLVSGKRVDTNVFQPGIQSIPADGASHVMDYFRQ